MKTTDILGLNARYQLFSSPYNTPKGRAIAASKLRTKRYLKKADIPIPERYGRFVRSEDLTKFDWSTLPKSFALKPNKGLGGEGIIVVKKRSDDGDGWITTQRKKVTVEDLELHVNDILEGAYSMRNVPDIAYIEEFVGRHKAFRKYAFRGTPDIRIIVFNKVPVMAMLRLPTKESGGRANLHQGAIAVGIDIATGITTKAIWHNKPIRHKPGTKRKLHGIKIPHWNKILEIAVRCQEVTYLGYLGADIVLHPEKGPMVLELNYQPGLSIQLANEVGLKKRLERVDDLKVRDAEHGVKIAKSLFAGPFADRVRAEEGVMTISILENIRVRNKKGQKISIPVKIDTGAYRSSVDRTLAEDLGLLEETNVLWEKPVRTSMGREKRPVINITYWLKGRKITTAAGISNRSKLKRPMIIGRKDLAGFLVDPVIEE